MTDGHVASEGAFARILRDGRKRAGNSPSTLFVPLLLRVSTWATGATSADHPLGVRKAGRFWAIDISQFRPRQQAIARHGCSKLHVLDSTCQQLSVTAARGHLRDEEIVNRIRAGDREAAQALHARYLPLLRGRVRKRMNGKVRRRVAESDVIQEAFIAIMSRLDDFEDRGEGSFGRWLSSVLDYKITDQLRRHVVAARRSVDHEETRSDAHGSHVRHDDRPSPSHATATDEAVRALYERLGALPDHYRRVLKLVHFEGLTLGDAALATGRSEEAVRRLYGRAVSRLREQLEA